MITSIIRWLRQWESIDGLLVILVLATLAAIPVLARNHRTAPALARTPDLVLGQLAKARLALATGDTFQAFESFHSALLADPERSDPHAPGSVYAAVDSLQKKFRTRLIAQHSLHPEDPKLGKAVKQSDDLFRMLAGGCQ